MRLVSYGKPKAWISGIEIEDAVFESADVARHAGWTGKRLAAASSRRGLLELGPGAVCELEAVAHKTLGQLSPMPLASVRLGPPVPDPQKIVCIGLNYNDHAMLVVTHEISFARDISSRVVFLHKGQVELQGKPAGVLKRGQSERFDQFLANTTQ